MVNRGIRNAERHLCHHTMQTPVFATLPAVLYAIIGISTEALEYISRMSS